MRHNLDIEEPSEINFRVLNPFMRHNTNDDDDNNNNNNNNNDET